MKKSFSLMLAAFLFCSCAPHIRFSLDAPKAPTVKVFIQEIRDNRPLNEKQGYKIFFISSIADSDYKGGFPSEFRNGLARSLENQFRVVDRPEEADVLLAVTVNHFYGEFFRTVKTVIYEYLSYILLRIPRLVTDFIPYNSFAGRAAMDLSFTWKDGTSVTKSFDVKALDKVCTYKRTSAFTASRLCRAASPEMSRILADLGR